MIKKRTKRVYPLVNEIVELLSEKRKAKVTFLDPRVVKVRWLDTDGVEEFSRDYFIDTNWKIAVRIYDV
jgi:hypothetical protein